jgi:DNA-binding NarL/FixJ family response regulator
VYAAQKDQVPFGPLPDAEARARLQNVGVASVLLIDSPPAVRQALRTRLSLEPDLMIVGEADDANGAISLAQTLDPDVVLVDAETPDLDAPGLVNILSRLAPQRGIVVICQDTAGTACGINGGTAIIVGKHSGLPALVEAVRDAAAGASPRGG